MIGDNIQKYRKEKGLSQQELAEELHVVRQTVSKWEKGISVPDVNVLPELSKLLGISVNVLLDLDEQQDGAAEEIIHLKELL